MSDELDELIESMASQLRGLGKPELADALQGNEPTSEPTPRPQTPQEVAAAALTAAEAHRQQEAEDFVQHLQDRMVSQWTSTPGLLEK